MVRRKRWSSNVTDVFEKNLILAAIIGIFKFYKIPLTSKNQNNSASNWLERAMISESEVER